MHSTNRKLLAAIGAALTMGLGSVGLSMAQDGHEHKHGAPLHGGKVAMTKEYYFEVVFAKNGVSVYPRTHEDKPIDVSRLSGTATFYHPSVERPWFERKLVQQATRPGQAASSIGYKVDLSKVPETGAKVAFKVEGLPEPTEPTATFTVPIALASTGELVVAKAGRADRKAIAAQKVCPVSKEDLESMGVPLKVSRGDKSIFICCKDCLKEIQANPDKFLGASAADSKR
jgi:hypothetical protein